MKLQHTVSDEAKVLIRHLGRHGSIITSRLMISMYSAPPFTAYVAPVAAPVELEVTNHHFDLREWAARGYVHVRDTGRDLRRNPPLRQYEVSLTEPSQIIFKMLEALDG
jgi:hypothetical protein